jgi:hypothetical protein
MTASGLAAALRVRAAGLYPAEAGIALLIDHGTVLNRADFTSRFIQHGTSISDGTTQMAAIDWTAVITALDAGEHPPAPAASGGSCPWPPASTAASRSTSATPSPASMNTTPACCSPLSTTYPGTDLQPGKTRNTL